MWSVLPTIDGACFAILIAFYDQRPLTYRSLWIVRKAGEYSYSVYLLHFFFVFGVAAWVAENIMPLPTIYYALPWAVAVFIALIGAGHISSILVEQPFLRLRRPYTIRTER